jgi:AcrR family transcriptional regulator
MNEIARAAGCSRATVYRYFVNREALRTAYVHREAYRLHDAITEKITGIDDPRRRLIAGLTTTLRSVRESPALSSWFATTQPPIGGEVAEHSEVINALAAGFLNSLGSDEPGVVERRARWLVRVITSLLLFPGRDDADEAAMVEEFVVPVVLSADQLTGQPVR